MSKATSNSYTVNRTPAIYFTPSMREPEYVTVEFSPGLQTMWMIRGQQRGQEIRQQIEDTMWLFADNEENLARIRAITEAHELIQRSKGTIEFLRGKMEPFTKEEK